MSELRPVSLTEDRVPVEGLGEAVEELVEVYGGELKESAMPNEKKFFLPLRRGVATSGGVECTLSWTADAEGEPGEAMVQIVCDREVDAPKTQRVLLLLAGIIGAFLFMLWPFFAASRALGTLAWVGGATAIAVYLLTLRKTSGGVAADFLARLAKRQRAAAAAD